MRISLRFRLGLVLALAAALAGCQGPCSSIERINGPALSANGVDFSTFVAVGTSLTAGYESGGVVNRHQVHSFPALFAQQVGKSVQMDGKGSFSQPAIDGDGLDMLLQITNYSPLTLSNAGRQEGTPVNLAQATAYHHLGLPGGVLFDFLNATRYPGFPKLGPSQTYSHPDYLLRNRGTVFQEAMSLQPTFMSFEYGANEVLGFAAAGAAPPITTGPAHAALMTASLNAIYAVSPSTRIAVFNVPDVTSIPYFTTIPPFVVVGGNQVPLVGANGPLVSTDLVTLQAGSLLAQGYGTVGPPLPESVILRTLEVNDTRLQIQLMNAVVDSVAQRPNVAKVDLNRLLNDIHANGYSVGGYHYTSAYIQGGLFGLDGIHPSDLGYALMANELIRSVNAKFGCAVPEVNPTQFATATASRARPGEIGSYPTDTAALERSIRQTFPMPR